MLMFVLIIGVLVESAESSTSLRNCKDVLKNGRTTTGVYQIQTLHGPRRVLCDQTTSSGGWTVIQQRFDRVEPFWNRTWDEYKRGFGRIGLSQSFYLGNDLISELTHQFDKNVTLRIEVYGDRNPESIHSNDSYFSEYLFSLGNESTQYTASIFLDLNNLVGNASNGWYDITYSNGIKFSTLDHINDPDPDCQKRYHMGGWWTHYCGLASLNGEYIPERFGDGFGLFFTIMGRYVINPKSTKMMIRDTNS